ncbi:MAG: acetyl-CoA carboxylase biotin carboxylase subunit [Chloroflexi bacterium]|nr:acetyl-CoA carboxylase biotin carboxylase subunit [Chloroflexota bacterium]
MTDIQPIESCLKFSKILIANRGEIAVRIIRACREMDIRTVAVYSEADANALHTRLADEAVPIGPPAPRESYLKIDRLLEAARNTNADAIHPGYGFLSENADFAEAVAAAGIVFIGPPAEAIRKMGSKTGARTMMEQAGVPVASGFSPMNNEIMNNEQWAGAAKKIGYPVLVKAAAGGGGKGMRIVRAPDELDEAVAAARREAANAFSDDSIFLEKYIESPRHIEFQVLADSFGETVHLFERECSIQRRHQKIIEETPSPFLTREIREKMGNAAVAAARAVGYASVGTVEFIVEPSGNFYFLEMNTRLQVEHPITEMMTGVDLVKAQIRIAAGERLWFGQRDLSQRGHAIECRVYAEDPANNFFPSVGKIEEAIEPVRPGVRVDAGVAAGDEVSIHYDPMIAKVIAHAETRADAIRKMDAALADYKLTGITTNISFLRAVLAHPAFGRGETTTHFIEEHLRDWQPEAQESEVRSQKPELRAMAADPWERADGFRLGTGAAAGSGRQASGGVKREAAKRQTTRAGGHEALEAAMPGLVRNVLVKEGDLVEKGQALVLLEAMKMEIRVAAPHAGKVVKVLVSPGETVDRGQRLIELGH